MKVVINKCFGGFGLSAAAQMAMEARKGDDFSEYDVARDDADLVEVVEAMGAEANGSCAALAVVEVPDGVAYTIEDYDGIEHIAEVHRTWG